MASSRNRQRALARAKLERQMARRAATARRRRQTLAIIGIAVAVIVVVAGGGLIIYSQLDKGGGHKKNPPKAADKADNCYTKAAANNPNLKNVGMPKGTDAPKSGKETMTIASNVGTIKVKLDPAKAPCNVHSFAYLGNKKFFDNTPCHRLTLKASGLEVLQCGDPSGTGGGGPTYTIKDENLPKGKKPTYPAGTVAVAKTDKPNSGSSQFFIVYGDSNLPANYSVIGTVTKGLDAVKKVAKAGVKADPSASPGGKPASDGAPKKKVTIKTLRVNEAAATPSTSPSTASKS